MEELDSKWVLVNDESGTLTSFDILVVWFILDLFNQKHDMEIVKTVIVKLSPYIKKIYSEE